MADHERAGYHRGQDGLVHRAMTPDGSWLCGHGSGGSAQREDLDLPACSECKEKADG